MGDVVFRLIVFSDRMAIGCVLGEFQLALHAVPNREYLSTDGVVTYAQVLAYVSTGTGGTRGVVNGHIVRGL